MAEVRERESSLYKNKKGGKYPLHGNHSIFRLDTHVP